MTTRADDSSRWLAYLARYHPAVAIAVGTAVITAGTVLLVYAIHQLFAMPMGPIGTISAVVVPIIVTPPVIYLALSLLNQLNEQATRAEVLGQRERAILDASLDGLITMDQHGIVQEFGPAAVTMFGYERNYAIGRLVSDLIVPPDLREAHKNGLAHFLTTGQGPVLNTRIEVPAVRANGQQFPCELTVVPVQMKDGSYSFTAFVRDISERTEQNRLLEAALAKAEESSEAKTRFLTHITHELRSPLHAVLGSLELVTGTTLDDEQRLYTKTGQQACNSLLGVIEDILDFSKIESGVIELRSEPFSLHTLIDTTLDLMAMKVGEKPLSLCSVIRPEVPDNIISDDVRLRQILVNVLDNAIKFTETGGVSIHVGAIRQEEKAIIEIQVCDTGIGIDPEKIDSLFSEFSQVDNSSSTRYGGTGLGLAIVKNLLDRMGGRIIITSDDTGTQQRIELPVMLDQAPEKHQSLRYERAQVVSGCEILQSCLSEQLTLLGIETECSVRIDGLQAHDNSIQFIDEAVWNTMDNADIPETSNICFLYNALDPTNRSKMTELSSRYFLAKPIHFRQLCALLSETHDGDRTDAAKQRLLSSFDQHHSLHMLIAEDSLANQFVTRSMLESAGHTVATADNGVQAVEAACSEAFDVILMDVRMPDMDGIAATKQIKNSNNKNRNTPIIGMSANSRKEDIEASLEAGMDSYISKPTTTANIIATIESILDQNKSRPGSNAVDDTHTDRHALVDQATQQRLIEDTSAAAFEKMITMAIAEIEQTLADIKTLDITSAEGGSMAAELGHRQRSGAGNFGFLRLARAAQVLEDACRSASTAEKVTAHRQFISVAEDTLATAR